MTLMKVFGKVAANLRVIDKLSANTSKMMTELTGTVEAVSVVHEAVIEAQDSRKPKLSSVTNIADAKKRKIEMPEGTHINLQPFWNVGHMLSSIVGQDGFSVMHVDESPSYYIVFIRLVLNMKTSVLKSQDELEKLSMKLGTDYESSVYSGKALLNGEPCFLLGFPKIKKDKLLLSDVMKDMPEYAKAFKIPFAVCQRVDKTIYWVDLVEAGHSKIIGTSGSGKTVFSYGLITQAMKHPNSQLFMIDMKQSEKDWGDVSRCLPKENFGNSFSSAIRVLNNVLAVANERRTTGGNDPIILFIEECDKMMNKGLVEDENPVDQQFPSKDQHKLIRQRMTLVASELRSLGVICLWVGQGALSSEVGSNIAGQFKTVFGMTVTDSQKSQNATGRGGENLHLLSGNGDMQVYLNGKRVRGNSPFCTQQEAVEAVNKRYSVKAV